MKYFALLILSQKLREIKLWFVACLNELDKALYEMMLIIDVDLWSKWL